MAVVVVVGGGVTSIASAETTTRAPVVSDRIAAAQGIFDPTVVTGDFDNDDRTDLAVIGATTSDAMPSARSNGDGKFTVFDGATRDLGVFAGWAQIPDVRTVTGDFNGDGRSDLALVGGKDWTSIPVALSAGNGAFTVSNQPVANFAGWAQIAGAKVIDGDFNGDGRTDLAITGVSGFTTVPVAFSTGTGAFTVTNQPVANFPGWSSIDQVKVIPGDFNGDRKTDLALAGPSGAGFTTIPLAFSTGTGAFTVTNKTVAEFPGWASIKQVRIIPGDFNNDGRADLALTGPAGFVTVPVAFSTGDGAFTVTNKPVADFPGWSSIDQVKVASGDFNGDGRTDLALAATSGDGFSTIPVAFSNGNGTFTVTNRPVATFPGQAKAPGAQLLSGDFNADGRADLALAGGGGWNTVPVAFSSGDGNFATRNDPVGPGFARAAARPWGPLAAPRLFDLTVSGTEVTIDFADASVNERGFDLMRSVAGAGWQLLRRFPTKTVITAGQDLYQHPDRDTDTKLRRCYKVVAFNDSNTAESGTQCAEPVVTAPPPISSSVFVVPLTADLNIPARVPDEYFPVIHADLTLKAGESRRVSDRLGITISSAEGAQVQNRISCADLNDPERVVAPASSSGTNHLGSAAGQLGLEASLLFTAPYAGTFRCEVVAATSDDGRTNYHMTAVKAVSPPSAVGTWLKVSAGNEVGHQWYNLDCDPHGTGPHCVYLGAPGDAVSTQIFMDRMNESDDTIPIPPYVWTAGSNVTEVDVVGTVQFTTCPHGTDACDAKHRGSGGLFPGKSTSTIITSVDLRQLNPDGSLCRLFQSHDPATGNQYTISDDVHHFPVNYHLTATVSPNCGGSRSFTLSIGVLWRSGDPIKIDGSGSWNSAANANIISRPRTG